MAVEVQTEIVLEDLRPDEQRIVRKLLEEDQKTEDEEGRDHEVPKKEEEPLAIEEKEPLAIEEEGIQGDLFVPETLRRDKLLFHTRFRLSEY